MLNLPHKESFFSKDTICKLIIILLEYFLITYTFLPGETCSVGPESVSTVVTYVGSGLSAMMKKQVCVITVYTLSYDVAVHLFSKQIQKFKLEVIMILPYENVLT